MNDGPEKMEPQEGSRVEVTGALGAVSWDRDHKPRRLALFTRRVTYEIDVDENTAPLVAFQAKHVVVKGTVRRNARGMKSIDVVEFRPVQRKTELVRSDDQRLPVARKTAAELVEDDEYTPTLDELAEIERSDDGEATGEVDGLDTPRRPRSRAGARGRAPVPA